MKSLEQVKFMLLMERKGYKYIAQKLSEYFNKSYSENGFGQKLARGDLRYDEFLAICDILGWKIDVTKNV